MLRLVEVRDIVICLRTLSLLCWASRAIVLIAVLFFSLVLLLSTYGHHAGLIRALPARHSDTTIVDGAGQTVVIPDDSTDGA
jgi:hypothetical protein